jgi:hypothetical protein
MAHEVVIELPDHPPGDSRSLRRHGVNAAGDIPIGIGGEKVQPSLQQVWSLGKWILQLHPISWPPQDQGEL